MNTSSSSSVTCISERNYAAVMAQAVEPSIQAVCTEGVFVRVRGEPIHWERYAKENFSATIAISHGFTESCEKYAEMIYYFLDAGYQVFICDHRGHGRSYRAVKEPWLTHVEHFSDYIEDFHYFVTRIVKPQTEGKPLYLYAHSMGGAIGARFLELYPDLIDRAVLTSPMLELNSGGFPMGLAKRFAQMKVRTGHERDSLFIHRPFSENEPFERSYGTSRARYDYYLNKQAQTPHLQNSAATYSWMLEALAVTAEVVKAENCRSVTIPVLLFQAGHDDLVKPRGQQLFISQIAHGRLVRIPDAKHEIYRSSNRILQPYLSELLQFFDGGAE